MLRRTAWAKINLTLHITGRRPDGYHELESLIVFAGVGDELAFAPADDLTLSIGGPFAPALGDEDATDNLVMRAARALRARLAGAGGARMRLDKRLPVAAGLGGGSADAAAALLGLAALWNRARDGAAAAAELAPSLGADVPVCLAGGPSFVTGMGERIVPAPDAPPAWLVLANPGKPLATGAVFAARTGAFTAPRPMPGPVGDVPALAAQLRTFGNDLQPAARRLMPDIGEVLAALAATDGCLLARLSGSGPTCFGLYASAAAADAAAAALRARHANWWIATAAMRGRDNAHGGAAE